jgi:glyoxylase I family protein
MPALKNIHHIAIIASNYQRSKEFYTRVLGFEVIAEVYREQRDSYKLDLALNGLYQVELFSFPDSRERASYPEARGLRHLAFAVDNVQEWITYLRACDVQVEDARVDEFTGKKFTFFPDPDGQPLELYEV